VLPCACGTLVVQARLGQPFPLEQVPSHHALTFQAPSPPDRRFRRRRAAARRLWQEGFATPGAHCRGIDAGAAEGQGLRGRPRRGIPPFEGLNDRGDIVGFDIEVVQAVARKSGIDVKFVNTPWQGLFDALGRGDRDMLVSAITITTERRKTMDFSDPYFDARQLIAVGERGQVARFADLRNLKVGVQVGSNGDEAVTRLLSSGGGEIKRFELARMALKELDAGSVDAVVTDNGVVLNYMTLNPGSGLRTVSDREFVLQGYGIALRKGNAELLTKINQGLAGIRTDGSYDALYVKYFGRVSAEAGTARDVPARTAAAPAFPASR
jgi:polar amino acid transport system substrate-binding protein